jgi:hypothetical protein
MAKQALISPKEPRENGYRVAQVVDEGQTFEVGGLFWTPCADDVVADQFYYNTSDKEIYPMPEPAPAPESPIPNS